MISVIMPAYNAAETLAESVASVVAQTWERWELIIINDGSIDDTGALADKLASEDERIFVVHQKNQGLGGARNTGLKQATGDWVHCLDADDLIDPDFYQVLIQQAKMIPEHPLGRCLFTGWHVFIRNKEIILTVEPENDPPDFSFKAFAAKNQGPCHAYFFERKVLEHTGVFDSTIPHCHDWDLWIRFARMGVPFTVVPKTKAWYRMVSSSLSRNFVRYVNTASMVIDRTTKPDPRISTNENHIGGLSNQEVNKAKAALWLENVRRAIGQEQLNQSKALFDWAKLNLLEPFWPEDDPRFFWNWRFRYIDYVPPENEKEGKEIQAKLTFARLLAIYYPSTTLIDLAKNEIEGALVTYTKTTHEIPAVQRKAWRKWLLKHVFCSNKCRKIALRFLMELN